jgi:hypothetical protein
MNEPDLQPLLNAAENLGRAKAKQELLDLINNIGALDPYRPVTALEIVTEVFVWIRKSDAKK